MSSVVDLQRELNNPSVFGTEAMRLCLYSKGDAVVGFEDVQAHVKEARGKGYVADGIAFERSAHCALPIEHGERYLKAVEGFWEAADEAGVEKLCAEIGNESLLIKSML
jgi:hypothetical protein